MWLSKHREFQIRGLLSSGQIGHDAQNSTHLISGSTEKRILRLNRVNQKKKSEFNYSIFYNDLHVGAVGVRIHPVYSYIGEVGCFVDERYWNKGIASAAVKKIEEFIFDKLSIKRLEMIIATPNKASEKLALKNGYKREGTMRERLLIDANYFDCYLYAKIMK